MTRDELLEALGRELRGHPDLDFALLFGSWARGRQHPESDVDVAIRPREGWSLAAELDLQGRLAHCVGATVDLIRLDEVPLLLAWEIVSSAILICGATEAWARYQAEVAIEHAEAAPALERTARHYAQRIAELGVPR